MSIRMSIDVSGIRGRGISDRLSHHYDHRLLCSDVTSRLSATDLGFLGNSQRGRNPHSRQG